MKRARKWIGGALMLAVAVATGCVSYRPMPLTSRDVDRVLSVPSAEVLSQQARGLQNADPTVSSLAAFNLGDGLSPREAAVVAVLVNPTLRADRHRLDLANAQLVQAGLLPNPQFSFTVNPVIGGNSAGSVTGYGGALSWDITSLIVRDAKRAEASAKSASVRLDVAWKEWQASQSARLAVYQLIAAREQAEEARAVDERLAENLKVVRRAVEDRLKTLIDLAAAETAAHDAHAARLTIERDAAHQRFALNRALGFPGETDIPMEKGIKLPSQLTLPTLSELTQGLDERRLDLVALRRGYDSQEAAVHAAVLAQFPKIGFGVGGSSDTDNVHTLDLGLTIDLPIFDRGIAAIETEKVTRQQLYDEYIDRVFSARADIAMIVADIEAITRQLTEAEAALPSLERLVAAYRDAADARNADVLSYYTAQNSLAQTRIEVITLRKELVQNAIGLELASGRHVLDDAATPSTRPAPAATTEPAQ